MRHQRPGKHGRTKVGYSSYVSNYGTIKTGGRKLEEAPTTRVMQAIALAPALAWGVANRNSALLQTPELAITRDTNARGRTKNAQRH